MCDIKVFFLCSLAECFLKIECKIECTLIVDLVQTQNSISQHTKQLNNTRFLYVPCLVLQLLPEKCITNRKWAHNRQKTVTSAPSSLGQSNTRPLNWERMQKPNFNQPTVTIVLFNQIPWKTVFKVDNKTFHLFHNKLDEYFTLILKVK